MITEIYFVRHAHSVFSLDEEETRGLSEKGWKDAKKVTEILLGENIDYIVSSPYTRAIQTVEGLARRLTKKIILDEDFRERDLASRSHHFDDPFGAMEYVFENPYFHYPGGESNKSVQRRGIEALKEIILAHKGKKIAIGIHGHIMTCTMNYFSDQYNLEFWKSTSKPDIYKLQIDENFNLLHCKRLWNEKTETGALEKS
ncbi:histidine phosphatase family protein [Bacillus sp. AFS015802]|uniref:histidine phosphatase family protein n=1 Tax=Bacillus sp. AFS015802 TaxID=2033486 RepID=UPI000BF98A9D|nr:histidine phosphatase family protein [Bacillus sp. AFS015802]PFA67131.1 histidine phosphatase family protein [Bacillus sp. AFS015802]